MPMPGCALDVSKSQDQKQEPSSWCVFLEVCQTSSYFPEAQQWCQPKSMAWKKKPKIKASLIPVLIFFLVCLVCLGCLGKFSLCQFPQIYKDPGNFNPFIRVFWKDSSKTGVLFLLMDTHIDIKKQAFLEECTGSDWDRLNFLHSHQ